MMKLISRNQLQEGIKLLAKASLHRIKNNPEIAFTTLRDQVEKDPNYYLQQQLAQEKIRIEKAKLLNKLKIYSDTNSIMRLKISIIGAGPAGLFTAYSLARQGAEVTIYEARSRSDVSLRPQNISFKEAEIHLKGLLEKNLYQKLFQRGAALDHEKKLRISIGTFQEVLLEAMNSFNVQIHYNSAITLNNFEQLKEADCILIAAGAHAYQRLTLQKYFEQEVFEQYKTQGKSALYIRSSAEPSGFTGHQREGQDWWRKNKTVFSGSILSQDIDRVIAILSKENSNESKVKQLEKLKTEPKVEYTFFFGNNSPDFLKNLEMDCEPIIQSEYIVTPTILCNPISEYQNKPLIVIGDGNGTPHPLAAIGTLKFTKDAKELINFLATYKQSNDLKHLYALTAMETSKKVFYANILSAFFSQKDNFTLS